MRSSKYIIAGLMGILAATSSCKKWLTVQPKTQMPADDLFTTENGFQDALTGVYIQMKDAKAYGENMTYGTIERLISSWDVTTNTTEQRLGLMNYADAGVQTRLSDMFGQEYKIIAGVNSILGALPGKQNLFVKGNYEMILGECLAIRAYCHLDMLRLFGPVPGQATTGTVLPYVKTLSNQANQHLPYDQFKLALMADLDSAAALMKDVDPIVKYSMSELMNPNLLHPDFTTGNVYMAYRGIRLNYYAVKALQARAALWFRDNTKAYACAKEVILATNPNGTTRFPLASAATLSNKDMNMSGEQVFGLYDYQLYTKYQNKFANGTYKKGSTAATVTSQLYGGTGTDIRETYQWTLVTLSNGSSAYIYKKHQVSKPRQILPFTRYPCCALAKCTW
ncbi:RagB/SusD family nutrient uptake outer membrane protein [Chitinophaga sedimenti]|uniref:RagB/SusD family nutrient uptake outer membrane protein n=1 Tax=Chitinophaga sedimenti TaxID=2033606 RepID=UPI002006BA9F|nr:RagB/SusD family nutrient uptake outer membrane protein [Chitinophaga sedimenti]MCK7553691.1 RagB/SusD family nutrient uptake outer membrane protein [Chitinophaga sedimenti]